MSYLGDIPTENVDRSVPEGASVLPSGSYKMVPVKAAVVPLNKDNNPTKNNGMSVEVEFDIIEPAQYSNRKFWDRFNIQMVPKQGATADEQKKVAQAVQIGKKMLGQLGNACGIFPALTDEQQVLGKEILAELGIKPGTKKPDGGMYDPKNVARRYWPVGTDIKSETAKLKGGSAPIVGYSGGPAPAGAMTPTNGTSVAPPWKK